MTHMVGGQLIERREVGRAAMWLVVSHCKTDDRHDMQV
jgi:hypothetical protein